MEISPTTIGRFVIAVGAAAGWYVTGSVTQEPLDVRAPQTSVARPISSSAIPDSGFTETLRERMKQPPMPRRGRNPFAYGSRQAAPPARSNEATAAPVPLPAVETAPPLPVFKLSGIAARQVDGAREFTAIIIDNGTMVFAKAGDTLSNGHTVVSVDDMSVTLMDAAGVTETLRLP